MVFTVWMELAWLTGDSPADTIKAIILGIAVVGGAAIAVTAVSSEVQEIMFGTRELINDWLQKRRDEAKEEGVEIGREQGREQGIELGRAEMREEILTWVERRDTAIENDEPFNEPPPWDDKANN